MRRSILPLLLSLALCLGMLPTTALAVETKDTGAFQITPNEGSTENSYTYSDGVLTVQNGANITISMASGATEPTSDRIVVAANATANITLNGVNITGPAQDSSTDTKKQSAIDLSENATLILNLSENSQNTLTGGAGGTGSGVPGIHVPSSASLVVCGSGGLSVTGGSSSNEYGGNGIGGISNGGQGGEACGTVIILSIGTVTISGGNSNMSGSNGTDIGGGSGTQKGDDGQGIRPVSGQENTYTVWGDLSLPDGITIPQGATVTIPAGASLTVPQGTTLTNSGTILVQGGEVEGTVSGNQPTYPSKVTVSFSQDGKSVASVPYGSTVTITATMEKAETAANALSADTGKVDFYLGDANDTTGIKLDTGTVEFKDGAYTASVEVTLDDEKGVTEVGTITITADFGGYAPEGNESDDSLAPNTGSAQLTVTKAEQSKPTGAFSLISSTENSLSVNFFFSDQPANENGVEIAYAEGLTAEAPTSNWTTAEKASNSTLYSATIGHLSPGTPYVFFARYKEGEYHKPSPPIVSDFAPHTKPKIKTTNLPNAYVGVEYSQKLEAEAAEGVAVSWTITSGTLPAGLTLSSDGTITGTPTTPTTQAANFTVKATIGEGASSVFSTQTLTVSVTKSDAELGGLNVSGNTGIAEGAFQYGDTITVTFTPERKANTNTNALAENTATLTYTPTEGAAVELATATAQADGSFKLTYDTKKKELPIGEDLTLTVSYGGSGALNPVEKELTVTLEQATLKNRPTLTGNIVYGDTITANYTKQDDETVTYQWYRGDQPIDGATSDTYMLTAEDVGQSITVAVTATDDYHTGSVTSAPVTVTQYTPPANPNYRIDLPTPEHGAVTKDPAAAKAGETVTLTPAPDEGYEVGEVIVTDRFGDTVDVTANPDGTYTFTMPNGQVKVEVTFVEVQPEPLPFTDVSETDWFHDAVRYVYDNGLMDGVGDGQFAPNATTNRAMVVTILYRLAGEPAVAGDVGFTDVESGLWYSNAVAWAAQNGIVNGISATEFAPAGDLTREQLATILYRYAESMGYDVSASADLSGFPDAGDIQAYAMEALSWAVAEGLLQGFEDDSLQPQSTATRAQIATILMRFCEGVGA